MARLLGRGGDDTTNEKDDTRTHASKQISHHAT